MSGWYLYHIYPKTSAKLTKALLIFLLISVLLGYLMNIFSKKLTEDQKSTIHGHLISRELNDNAKATIPCLLLKLQEYPKQNFIYQDKYCRGLDKENFKTLVSIGDTVTIRIPKASLNNTNSDINILHLSSKKTIFLSQVSIDKEWQDENQLKTVALIIVIAVLLLYVILDLTGVIDRIKTRYFTETKTELTSLRDFNEFPD